MTRKITFLLTALIFSSAAFSQISFDDDRFDTKGNPDVFGEDVKTYMHNNSTNEADSAIKWKAIDVSFSDGWEPSVCTGELCVTDLTKEYGFDLPMGEKMDFKLGFTTINTSGNGCMTVVAWNEANPFETDTVTYCMSTWGASVKGIDQGSFDVYPNPAKDVVTINLLNGGSDIIKIYDILGNEILSRPVTSGDNVDVSSLTKGVYIIRTQGNLNYSKTIQKL